MMIIYDIPRLYTSKSVKVRDQKAGAEKLKIESSQNILENYRFSSYLYTLVKPRLKHYFGERFPDYFKDKQDFNSL